MIDPNDPELARIESALLALPRRTREIFLARRLDDLSYVTIATITGLSVEQVERHMTMAIAAIDRSATKAAQAK